MKNSDRMKTQVFLEPEEHITHWYNINADFKTVAPFLRPDGTPVEKADLKVLFPDSLIEQEFSKERFIEIPKEVKEVYSIYRATPLHRAYQLEKALGTPARLYYKYEGVNPSGSHKLNTAIPQAFYNKQAGINKLTTETGAGQWGTALSVACSLFGLTCDVYMVKISGQQKPQRKQLIETYGANVYLSPSDRTESGRKMLAEDAENPGSLGMAISEAVEIAAQNSDINYALGSVMNHVALHQTIIGQEAKKQLDKIGETADMVISCCGGGSNFAGLAFPFAADKINGKSNVEIIGVEPTGCPTLTKGKYCYDFGDVAHFTPMMLQYTLGNKFQPPKMHAGGLRYHGMSSQVSQLIHEGYARAEAVTQTEVYDAAILFAKSEIILPAPESAHAIAQVIKEAIKCKENNEEKVIVFNVTGHGNFDMQFYNKKTTNELIDIEYTEEMLKYGFDSIPNVPANDIYLNS